MTGNPKKNSFFGSEIGLEIVRGSDSTERVQSPPSTCFIEGGYFAEIVASDAPPRRTFHYVVQRVNSSDLICCGQTWTYEEAENQVRASLEEFKQMYPEASPRAM